MDKKLKTGVTAALLSLVALIAPAAWAKTVKYPGELKAWRVLTWESRKGGYVNTLRLLKEFIQKHKDGEHASDARYAVAETLFLEGLDKNALPHFQRLIDRKDGDYYQDALLRAGEIHYNAGDNEQARKYWEKLESKSSSKNALNAEAIYGLALCELREEKFLNAERLLDRLVKNAPAYGKLSKIRELRGILHFQQKEFRQAVATLEDVSTPVAAFYRGLSFFHEKQYQEAAQAFNSLSGMPPSPYTALGAYLKADCFRLAQNHPLALMAFGDFLVRHPDSNLRAYALIHQARALNRLDRPAEALQKLDEFERKGVSVEVQAGALALEAETAALLGDFKRTLHLPKRAEALLGRSHPDHYASVLAAVAYNLVKMGKAREGAEVMKDLLREFPMHPLGMVAHLLNGYQANEDQDWSKAISSYETALLKYNVSQLSDTAMAMMLTAYFEAGKYQELVTNANRVMNVVNSDFSAQDHRWRAYSHLLIAESYYRIKQFSDASEHYQEVLKEPFFAESARLSLAWARFRQGNYKESLRLATQVQEQGKSPEEHRASAALLLAGSHFNLKNNKAAIDGFRAFRKRYPNDVHVPESWLHEGWAHRQGGQYGQALNTWRSLTELFPASPLAQEAELQVGRLYFQAREFANAVKTFEGIITRWPKTLLRAEALWMLAQSYYNDKQDELAIRAYQKFIARHPDESRVPEAQTQIKLAMFRGATQTREVKALARFVRAYPTDSLAPEAQYLLAQVHFEEKSWSKAVKAFRKILLDYPASSQAPQSLLTIAHAQEQLKKHSAALIEYKSLMELFPGHVAAIDAAMRSGAINFGFGKFKEAAESFRFVTEREAPEDIKSNAHYNMAVSFKKNRSFPEAAEALERFVGAYPKHPKAIDAQMELAAIYAGLELPDKAVAAFEQVLKRDGIDQALKMEIYNQLGELNRKMGAPDKAVDSYSQLLGLSPLNHNARLLGLAQLAAIYEERETWDKAVDVYDQIQKSGGKAEWLRSASKRSKEIRAFLLAQQTAAAAKAAAEGGGGAAGAASEMKDGVAEQAEDIDADLDKIRRKK